MAPATSTIVRRRNWTVAEWAAFTARCRAARDELLDLAHSFLAMSVTSASLTDALIRGHNRTTDLMIQLETLIIRQHSDLYNDAITFVYGPSGAKFPDPCEHLRRPMLTREEWATFGGRVMSSRATLMQLGLDLEKTKGAPKSLSGGFIRFGQLEAVRVRMASLLRRQHPDWRDYWDVFGSAGR